MPEAAPVTRAVFPLMNMSHFLQHLVRSSDKCLRGQTLKVIEVNLFPTFCLLQYEVYSYLFQPLHMTIFGKQLNI